MKVKGPGGPKLPAAGAAGAEKGTKAGRSEAARPGEKFSAKVADKAPPTTAPATSAGTAQAAQVPGALPPETLRAITSKLSAGKITRAQAVTQLVDAVVSQGPGRVLGPKQREALRAHLNDTLAGDPVLADRVRAMGGDDGD